MPPSPHQPVLCLGEALIDVVDRGGVTTEHVGGSPLNVACGCARLGHPTTLASWWADDQYGHRIDAFAMDHDVAVTPGTYGALRTSVAYARLDEEGRATYEFEVTWQVADLPSLTERSHLHTGSIAAILEPGGSQLVETVRATAGVGTVSYDPNVRPTLFGSPSRTRGRVEELVALSDVVKASDEDVAWLYPGEPVEDVLRRWAALGPGLVVVTRGAQGANAVLSGRPDTVLVEPLGVDLADTVGAGDSFTAGLISGLLDASLLGGPEAGARLREATWESVMPALHRAAVTSGLTVSHHGAYSPSRDEVERVLAADPGLRG
ncbi:carbohydrate kinase family protein [Raineyella fluvialis]|uniref:Carbohydrate kinase n=1 Tax=Raineyella fluvialis TaxID=2662261 RepID=A0A5Q2FBU1_9ACTN|nr:carbohydrate kinase [Raineyella fluvialis]QGF24218.1 carbohydrate kinase [Raineyella fluvialis]